MSIPSIGWHPRRRRPEDMSVEELVAEVKNLRAENDRWWSEVERLQKRLFPERLKGALAGAGIAFALASMLL